MKTNDMVGFKFGMLTVIEITRVNNQVRCRCICVCGKEKLVYPSALKSGNAKSCGCGPGAGRVTHGLTKSGEYRSWVAMKGRCYRERDVLYRHYWRSRHFHM